MIEGGCQKCGLYTQVEWNDIAGEYIICQSCYHKYYSKEAIRDKKLEELLKPTRIERIKRWIKGN
jgi:hypothetical protein